MLLADRENFAQAKRAIDLGVEGYLVKPVESGRTVEGGDSGREEVEERTDGEICSVAGKYFSVLPERTDQSDRDFNMLTSQRFGFTVEEPGAVFAVWLGDGFEEQKEQARSLIGQSAAFGGGRVSRVFEARVWKILLSFSVSDGG